MDGYPSGDEGCAALTADLYNASALVANAVIKRNARYSYRRYHHRGRGGWRGGTGRFRSGPPAPESPAKSAPAPAEDGADGGKGEDAYGTNVQETGVDEADIIKSDGEHVFTGYGDILIVWDAVTGKELSRTKMPERKVLTREEGGYEFNYDRQRKSHISGLLLDSASSRLAVFVSGYSSRIRYDYELRPTLNGKRDTRVLLYDTESLPTNGSELLLISSDEMDGEYCSARMIKGVAHMVRQSTVNTYQHIQRPLSRYLYHDYFWRASSEDYIKHATLKAKEILPTFAQRMTEELKDISGGNDCSAVARVALFASGGDSVTRDGFPDSISSAILKSYLQVSSIDVASPITQREDRSLASNVKSVGSFFPSTNPEMYASKSVMVVAGRGYHRDEATLSWGQSTHFLAYQLHEDGSKPTGLGMSTVPGYVLNQFAMDEYQGYFRVATTERARWACVPVPDPTPLRHSYHWPRCRWERATDSRSQLAIMKFPEQYGEMNLIKVIRDLGVTEEIKSVRFFDDKAYIVTFMRTDPLYTIDFRDPENPVVTDELKISGFSSYLHPVGKDRLLAIGKEADETTGRVTGFQITLFNVADLTNTSVLQRHTINQPWARNSAEGDHLAFRYLPESKQLILPISIRASWRRDVKDFDGFKVFAVSDEKIENRFSITMTTPTRMSRGCWYHARLPPRSLVFGGNLTVVKGHGYMSYDLDTEKMRWEFNLDRNVTKCSGYWG